MRSEPGHGARELAQRGGSATPRRRPWLFWAAVVVAAALLGTGVVIAGSGYLDTSGPDGTVRAYFTALHRGDAADALAFGDVPDGPHTLLTSAVLREQQRIAPIEGFRVKATHRNGDRARVAVAYTLAFPADPKAVSVTVPVHRVDGTWRLDQAAVATELDVAQAAQRATVLGYRVPSGTVLVFPGAVPIRLDSAYLQLQPSQDSVTFGAPAASQVFIEPSRAGTRAALAALTASLRSCLHGGADLRCPLPTERYVPGSVRGDVVGRLGDEVTVDVGDGDEGTLEVTGTVRIKGSYRRLGFDNRVASRRGALRLPVHARGFAVAPLRLTWVRSS